MEKLNEDMTYCTNDKCKAKGKCARFIEDTGKTTSWFWCYTILPQECNSCQYFKNK